MKSLPLFLISAICVARVFADPPPAPGKVDSMFDGKTMAGWEGDAKIWRVEDGCLTGGSLSETVKRNEFLATTQDYGDFIVRFKIKLTGSEGFINSGFQIRSQRVPNNSEMAGYQCDFGEPNWYGAIYDESRRNKVMSASDMAALRPVLKKDDWNEYVIRAQGPRVTTWINGVQGTDYIEEDASIARTGKMGIQVHGGGKAVVQVKDITVEQLPPPKPGETFIGAPPPKKGAKASPLLPEEERAAFSLPPGFEIELVASESEGIGKFVPIAFDQHGALWTTTALEYPVDGNENPAAADALYASKAKDKVLVYDRDPKSPTGYATKPRVFAEGLAIPLGVLPYEKGCYVQHGHDIVFLSDTDGDGKADERKVILTGFGVQDSHLFPHQFMRAPGGWIWMAQGAFNYSKVRMPDQPVEKAIQFDQTRMAKFRPDGSGFDITSNGPCNIWGLVLDGEGQAWIQEANDFGYPVMPFHEYANYPGCSDRQWKTYAPEFPGTAEKFRMGGTGLSGLALSDKKGAWPSGYADVMYVANPITRQIQAIKITPDGPRFKYAKLPDFINTSDEWFRPVAITFGPDGCLYIVDWYNKIISHNEVPRNHPERDKIRGRIWRVKYKEQTPFPVPDFAKLSGDELIAKLGGDSLAQSHLAWQALADGLVQQDLSKLAVMPKLIALAKDDSAGPSRRIQALWALEGRFNGTPKGSNGPDDANLQELQGLISKDKNPNVRREAIRSSRKAFYWASLKDALKNGSKDGLGYLSESDPGVRTELIKNLGRHLEEGDVAQVLGMANAPLAEPMAPSTQNGKPIKVREAYEREFERYLVRMFLERYPDIVARALDLEPAKSLSVEQRLLGTLALEPKASASRVAKLLPQLQRAPGKEEILRLVQFPGEPGVGDAIAATLGNPATSKAMLESLLEMKTKLDAAKITPLIQNTTRGLLANADAAKVELGSRLAAGFQLAGAEADLVKVVEKGTQESSDTVAGEAGHRTYIKVSAPAVSALRALRELKSDNVELFDRLARFAEQLDVREEALAALASSKAANAPARLLDLYPKLTSGQRRASLERLAGTKPGAQAIVASVQSGKLQKTDLDASTVDKLQAVLGNDPALAALMQELGALFKPVLALDGSEAAWTQTDVTLDGPCTVEAWVRLEPKGRKIGNADGILGAPGQIDINFYDAKFRVYGFAAGDVVIAKKPIMEGLWTHVAATRDTAGKWKLYIDGELDNAGTQPAAQKLENVRIAWTAAPGGPNGAFAEVRLWNKERSADEIRAASDRSLPATTPGLVFTSSSGGWGKLQAGTRIAKTSDLPPILTPDEATALDVKYTKFRALAEKPGDAARGKTTAILCATCHLMGPTGGNIGPNLSGVGAMGTEGILRNILQPNAAMENGYRIFRVELKNGDLVDALFVSEDKDAVVVRLPGADDRRIAKSEIRETKYLRRSLMPEGLLDAFTPEQVTDLFAFLKTMK